MLDVNSDTRTDYFISFSVPFSMVVGALEGIGISNVTENTAMTYVSASSTQANSLNQNLGGVDGGIKSSQTWEQLGGVSIITSPNGSVPEPATMFLLTCGAGIAWLLRLKQRTG